MPGLHHVEIWVADLAEARADWGWLLGEIGLHRESAWPEGESWGVGSAYLTLTTSPNLSGARPGTAPAEATAFMMSGSDCPGVRHSGTAGTRLAKKKP